MKKLILGVGLVLLLCTGSAFGYPATGLLTGGSTGVTATEPWWTDDDKENDATIEWTITYNPTTKLYTYVYTFTAVQKDISHINLQLSESIPNGDDPVPAPLHWELIPPSEDATLTYGDFSEDLDGESSPGLLEEFYGLKYELTGDPLVATFTIITDRAPMPGDFYAKDGVNNITKNPVYFWANNVVQVPDSDAVPIPGAVVILGFGLLGLVGARKKFVK